MLSIVNRQLRSIQGKKNVKQEEKEKDLRKNQSIYTFSTEGNPRSI